MSTPSTLLSIDVENIKCGGCERSIVKGLSAIEGISDIQIDRDQQRVSYLGNESSRVAVAAKLLAMGYPEKGTVQGLQAGLTNAKSLVSCAIGRMS